MIYISTFAQGLSLRAKVALTLSRERRTVMPIVIAPDPEPTAIERARLRALDNYIKAKQKGRMFRAAFWAGAFSGLGGLRSN